MQSLGLNLAVASPELTNYYGSTRSTDLKKLMAISGVMKLKDSYTESHGRRVSTYALRLALRIGLSRTSVGQIAMGGMLHDIGKMCMSDRIFTNENANLSKDMMDEVRRHPVSGVMLLKHIESLKPVLKYILFHHERIDGSGYPFGLRGEEIPLGAQIIGVADSFDAITTDRPYQKSKSKKEAFAILQATSGTVFSRPLVKAFISDIEEKGILLTEN